MNKKIVMPVEFVNDVARLLHILESEKISEDAQIICRRLFESLVAKVDAMDRREAFSKYITASIADECQER